MALQLQYHDKTLSLSGVATLATIDESVYQSFLGYLKQQEIRYLSLKDISEADSACVLLLIEAYRLLHHQDVKIKDIPSTVLSLLSLYRLDDWII